MIPLFTLGSIYSTNAASVSRFSLSIDDTVELCLTDTHTHLIRTPCYYGSLTVSGQRVVKYSLDLMASRLRFRQSNRKREIETRFELSR